MEHHQSITSPRQLLRVYGYNISDAPAGTYVVVRLHFNFVTTENTFLRIVVGGRALTTDVHGSPSNLPGEWDLRAIVPELGSAYPAAHQASTANCIIDSLVFGKYTFSRRHTSPALMCKQEAADEHLGLFAPAPRSHHSSSRPTSSGGGAARSRALNASMVSPRDAAGARTQLKKQSLIRARRSSGDDDDADAAFRASLVLTTATEPLARVCDWDEEERVLGRRLVRFTRVQEGCTLRVAAEPLRPSEYADGDAVVSCIHRPPEWVGPDEAPQSQCCITSVDIIFLLECLVGDNKAGMEEFFQKIMDFPAPKPRNIEKDVKVFDWAVLPQALDKIISKYVSRPAFLMELQAVALESSAAVPQRSNLAPSSQAMHAVGSYSASSSPVQDVKPSFEASYFYPQQHSYRNPYAPPLDGYENPLLTATGLPAPANVCDSFMSSHSHSPSPTPLLTTPADSPVMSLSYTDSTLAGHNQPMYPTSSFMDHSTYGSSYGHAPSASYDGSDYRRVKLPDLQGSHTLI
ncbi:uncharacterized protein BXZ73DRAFT_88763 [Epithele typhae]|uniref:uncharacterized protein n=1 Tax=Epithele typhae TaxID=378194 RepID=UPI002008BAA2|nr:uncharacterized protein BXZ73DRAFT_88763 [Epithele typhae]KAH9940526.1 hypothetical protein BXZ73DRAFT_88763 [Epithele typhae]